MPMSRPSVFKITYWGVTGTFCGPLLPRQVSDKIVNTIKLLVENGRLSELQPGPELTATITRLVEENAPFYLRSSYGGNTTCVEVETPDGLIILDCGSGYRELGVALEKRWKAEGSAARRQSHVLLTHAHIDHTFATAYFSPYYNKLNSFTIWGPKLAVDSITTLLDPKSSLSQVYFPPTYTEMKGIESFRPIEPGSDFMLGSTRISTMPLNHPGGSLAYRLEHGGRVFVFATDHEQAEVPDRKLAEFSRGADLLYTEGQYTEAEYLGKVGVAGDPPFPRTGWGHTPIEWCVKTALEAGVKRLHIGHRDPRRNDEGIAVFEDYLQEILAKEIAGMGLAPDTCQALVPFEGMEVEL